MEGLVEWLAVPVELVAQMAGQGEEEAARSRWDQMNRLEAVLRLVQMAAQA